MIFSFLDGIVQTVHSVILHIVDASASDFCKCSRVHWPRWVANLEKFEIAKHVHSSKRFILQSTLFQFCRSKNDKMSWR